MRQLQAGHLVEGDVPHSTASPDARPFPGERAAIRLEALTFCPWGLHELRIDQEALAGATSPRPGRLACFRRAPV